MRTLLDYTRTGRWKTITAAAPDPSNSEIAPHCAPPANVAIRRLLDFTRTGHWRTIVAEPAGPVEAAEPATLASAPALGPPFSRDAAAALATAGSEETQQLIDDSFFGVDVHELPAEKWQEIAPLFPR